MCACVCVSVCVWKNICDVTDWWVKILTLIKIFWKEGHEEIRSNIQGILTGIFSNFKRYTHTLKQRKIPKKLAHTYTHTHMNLVNRVIRGLQIFWQYSFFIFLNYLRSSIIKRWNPVDKNVFLTSFFNIGLYVYKYIYIYAFTYVYICAFICVYIYIYRYICTYVYIYIYIFKYILWHTYTHIYIFICFIYLFFDMLIYIYIYIYICAFTYVYICAFICVYIYRYIGTYVYIYIYIYIYIYVFANIYFNTHTHTYIYLYVLYIHFLTCLYIYIYIYIYNQLSFVEIFGMSPKLYLYMTFWFFSSFHK